MASSIEGGRKAQSLLDGVCGGAGVDAIVSFPGEYQDTWNEMVATVLLWKNIAKKMKLPEEKVPIVMSTACVFLPDGDELFGKHVPNDIDVDDNSTGRGFCCARERPCFCYTLYGERKSWGCKWFDVWRRRLEDVLLKGQNPVVVYKPGEIGIGDETPWARFPLTLSSETPGLGPSQKVEVAYLKRRLIDKGAGFAKRDVDRVCQDVRERSNLHFEDFITGVAGVAALADAIEHCKEVQEGLKALCLGSVGLCNDGGVALVRALQSLNALQRLSLPNCGLGKTGMAMAISLQYIPTLTELDLRGNNFGNEAGKAVATSLQHLSQLSGLLDLSDNNLGEEGGKALTSLQHLPKLSTLRLFANHMGEVGSKAVASCLKHLPELQVLWLGSNNLGEEGGKAIASGLQHLPKLNELRLSGNNLGEEAGKALAANFPHITELKELDLSFNYLAGESGKALAANLQHLPDLKELHLSFNDFGEEVGKALAASLEHVPRLQWLNLDSNPLGASTKRRQMVCLAPGPSARTLLEENWAGRGGRLILPPA